MDHEGYKNIMAAFKVRFEPSLNRQIPFKAVSPNPLSEKFLRMKATSDSFYFLNLPIHTRMTTAIKNLIDASEGGRSWYFEGPSGLGKSFTFLDLVMTLRDESSRYRVIYVNNPSEWKFLSFDYIINELIYAFARDENTFYPPHCGTTNMTITKTPLGQWYDLLTKAPYKENEAIYREFLLTARKFCSQSKLKLIAVLDQENELGPIRTPTGCNFPYSYYDIMPGLNCLITCSSANNLSAVKKSSDWKDLKKEINISFNEFDSPIEAAKCLFALRCRNFGRPYDKEFDNIYMFAGSNAQEIVSLVDYTEVLCKRTKYQKMFEEYKTERFKSLTDMHHKFLQESIKNNQQTQNYHEALTYLDLKLDLPLHLTVNYDKRLMYIENMRLHSVFPIARLVLLSLLGNEYDLVESLAKNYLALKVSGEGHPIELYIIHSLKKLFAQSQIFTLEMKNIKDKSIQLHGFLIEGVEALTVIPLAKPPVTTLYVPLDPCYPAIDCLIYDKPQDSIFPIKITLVQSHHTDSYKEWKEKYEKEWINVFKCACHFVWLSGKPKQSTKKDQTYFVASFESLASKNIHSFQIFKDMKTNLDKKLEIISLSKIEEEEEDIPV